MDAIELLKNDHSEAEMLLCQLEAHDPPIRDSGARETLEKLREALALHTRLEEEVFYPVLERREETRDMIKDAREEHRQLDELLSKMNRQGRDWDNDLSELRRRIEHHVSEEEGDLFPKAERLLSTDLLREMGRRMAEIKREHFRTSSD